MTNKIILRILPILAAISLNPLFVAAQLEEIVVTAQKRAESLQDVPISVLAFTGENLDELGVQSAEDIMLHIPNAAILPQGGSKINYYIRGVGTADFHLNVVGAVGVYLDDVALNSPFSVTFNTFDMERVEVLRGPQNTLFGRNTTGGAVNYISRKPNVDEGTNGYIEAGYGRFDQFDVEAGGGIALGDKAAARIAVSSNIRDGGFNNLTLGEDAGGYQRQAIRGQFRVQPDESWDLLLNVHGGISRSNPEPYKAVGLHDPANRFAPCPVPYDDLLPQNNPNCVDSPGFNHQYDDWEDVYGNLEFKENADTWGFSFKASWELDAFTVTSVTAFDMLEVEFSEDSDSSPNSGFQFYQDGEYDQWSQELRLQSASDKALRWIAGFYWFFEDGKYATAVRRTPAEFAPASYGSFNIVPNTRVSQDNEVYSAYGQVEYDMQPDVTATVGLRWTKETKKGQNSPSVRCVGTIGGPPFCPQVGDHFFFGLDEIPNLPALFEPPAEALGYDSTDWGARFAVDWQASDDMLLYGSISRGFKAGGFSLAALAALTGGAAQSVAPETLLAYEIGFKTAWLDNSLQLNGAFFYYDWSDLQSFEVFVEPTEACLFACLINIPEASLKGGELELTWAPAGGWLLIAGVGLADGEIDDAGNIPGTKKGNKLTNTPEVTFNGLVRKEFAMSGGVLALQTSWRYKDDVYYGLANIPNLSQDSIWNLDARASFRFGPGERYEVAAWGKNLNGEEYCRGMTSLQGLVDSNLCLPSLSEPTYGISAAIRFE